MIELVIKIPEEVYEMVMNTGTFGTYRFNTSKAIQHGTPLPKTGHWIAQDIHNCHTNFKCSECDYIHSFMHLYGEPTADYTYCPNCGAKMSGS